MKTFLRSLILLCAAIATIHASDSWNTNYQDALAQASKENKKVLLDFTGSDWCAWCQRIQKEIFSKQEFKTYAAKNLVLVEIDFPQTKIQSATTKKQNEELQSRYHVQGFPTLVLLTPKGKVLKQSSGYIEGGPKGFIKWAKE
ncbi:MAG: hypothetical protein A3F67_04940 [Verrucomicrobia bacterium RIFCSPHIGHO2_12_FULL_41_10]|nr:MAG: hypothetical protein A3F67_04940 [Verrucomicrobia bacterium RIFCSPHIGHO2_12_FULL_41_10]HLB34623.1 thioredoxin fold domain-containing protein [Chthoniobacterales bacterium]